jgi:hypothetical protein
MTPDNKVVQEKVIGAISETEWDFRTADGISKETNIPKDVVEGVVALRPDAIRISTATDRNGRLLYAPKSKPVTVRETLATLQQSVALV